VEQNLRGQVLTPGDQGVWMVFADLDHGMEWFEEQALQRAAESGVDVVAQPGAVQAGQERGGLALIFAALGEEAVGWGESSDQAVLRLMSRLEQVELEEGQVLIRQGEPHPRLYFLDAGELTIQYRTQADQEVRLETSGPGSIVGELGVYLGTPASASVAAAQASTVYSLSAEELRKLEREDPQAAALLHRLLLKRVGQRLRNALESLEALSP
jgi:hypothetical protein